MALDLDKTRRNAERLLQQGRLQAALEEYQRLAEGSPRDLPLLNLVGDLLSRMGRDGEACSYYDKIATEYARSGFFLKAIAILKKTLRTQPDRPDTLLRVGDLYLKQKLPGEARGYLLRAADRFVAARAFREAQEAYGKLLEADPSDPLHRLRHAETMAAAGDPAGAAAALLAVADTARGGGRHAEAERIYRRVLELMPGRPEAVGGLASCLAAEGKASEAVAALEKALQTRPDASLAVLLVSIEEQFGRYEEALRVLTGPFADTMPEDAFERVLRSRVERGGTEAAWVALESLVTRWTREGSLDRLARLLDRLARIEPDGHLPALKRLHELRRRQADGAGMAKTLEALAKAYRARSMSEEAAAVEERLKEIAPAARAEVRSRDEEKPEASVAVEAPAPARAPETREELGDGLLPIPAGVETPAVPLGPADEEFVTGRITQAEIFEKYGLMDQAVEQLREITKKFPGLSSAQERLADLLRGRGDRAGLRDTLVGLALAHRASGELEKAAQAAEQAALSARLNPETRTLLERLALLQSEPEAGEQKPVPAPSEVEAPAPKRAAAPPAPSRVEAPQPLRAVAPPAPRRVETPPASDEVEIVIDVEDAEAPVEAAAAAQSTVEAPAPSGVEVPAPSRVEVPLPEPPDEDLEEISFYLDQGMVQDARKLIASQRASGRGGERLGALEARAAGAQAPAASEELVVETVDDTVLEAVEGDSGRSDLTLDDAALESITAALRTDATSPEEAAPAPAAFDEQSVEEVFEIFKRHVEEEIGRDDYRTHYDLGIAYKEMGILDDAVSEFRIAAGSTDIFRDACSMIALCYREKGEIQEAAGWYRQALDAPGGDDEAIRGLRFDLAEVLEQCGENEAALDLFRAIHRDDPSYREVGQRIEELESRTR